MLFTEIVSDIQDNFCTQHVSDKDLPVFWSLYLRDFLSGFFHLAHLALQNVKGLHDIFVFM